MEYASCPSALVNAPVEIVWRLLTDPGAWGRFYDLRVTRVEPPGLATEGQTVYCESGPQFLYLKLTFEYIRVDPVRHLLNFDIASAGEPHFDAAAVLQGRRHRNC